MSTITCLKELEEKGELQYKDIVEFTIKEEILEYKVWSNFLRNLDTGTMTNDKIFKVLNLDKKEIATKIYGYEPENNCTNGFWPSSKTNDYPALTKLAKELYLIIEEKEMAYTKFTRFEIIEI